ncbi:MAG: hypothetical protein R2680_12445 [Nitrososphaeraceae archaeon]
MVVDGRNIGHNRFRKLFTRYEKKDENYIVLVECGSSISYMKLI